MTLREPPSGDPAAAPLPPPVQEGELEGVEDLEAMSEFVQFMKRERAEAGLTAGREPPRQPLPWTDARKKDLRRLKQTYWFRNLVWLKGHLEHAHDLYPYEVAVCKAATTLKQHEAAAAAALRAGETFRRRLRELERCAGGFLLTNEKGEPDLLPALDRFLRDVVAPIESLSTAAPMRGPPEDLPKKFMVRRLARTYRLRRGPLGKQPSDAECTRFCMAAAEILDVELAYEFTFKIVRELPKPPNPPKPDPA